MILHYSVADAIMLVILSYGSIIICYTIYNEKYFQKVSFCVITHPIGQNGRAVCKKHDNHGDARGAKRCVLGAASRPAIDREFEYSSTYEYSLGAGRPST